MTAERPAGSVWVTQLSDRDSFSGMCPISRYSDEIHLDVLSMLILVPKKRPRTCTGTAVEGAGHFNTESRRLRGQLSEPSPGPMPCEPRSPLPRLCATQLPNLPAQLRSGSPS